MPISLATRGNGVCVAALAILICASVSLADETEHASPPFASESAVFPSHRFPIRFDHAQHVSEAGCDGCHGDVATSTDSRQDFRPRMEDCGGCHPQAGDTSDQGECSFCHEGYVPVWPDGEGVFAVRDPRFPLIGPEPVQRFEPNISYSHADHLGVACNACHIDERGDVGLPAERLCLNCHNQDTAGAGCDTCHPSDDSGRLITAFGGNRSSQDRRLVPRNHGNGWDVEHGAAALVDDCTTCHTQSECLTCHQATIGLTGSDLAHAPGFRTHHGAEARRGQSDCTSCHDQNAFCIDCHIDAGFVDNDPELRGLRARFHEAGWVESSGHGRAAQLSLTECASCHQESTCAQCHVDINPHGGDFLFRCRELAEASPTMCLRCHDGSLEDLERLCL